MMVELILVEGVSDVQIISYFLQNVYGWKHEKGALERVIIDALKDLPEENALINEIVRFTDSLKNGLVPELAQVNKYNKATVGTFFCVRYPQHALRSFGVHLSKIDWSRAESLKELFSPFKYLGEEKPVSA